jgi:hypothetical protein
LKKSFRCYPKASLLNKSLVAVLGVTKFIIVTKMISSSFGCDQIDNNHLNELVHTLLCYFSPTWMFN